MKNWKRWLLLLCLAGLVGTMVCLNRCNQNKQNISYELSTPLTEKTEESSSSVTEMQDPVVEWCELYVQDGVNAVAISLVNPNDVAVDVSYDLVYYKKGQEVARNVSLESIGMAAYHRDLQWTNEGVPALAEVDEMKLENVRVAVSDKIPVAGRYTYEGSENGISYMEFSFDEKPAKATAWFLLYNDFDENQQFDQGEMVSMTRAELTKKTQRVNFEADTELATDFDVFCTAYR